MAAQKAGAPAGDAKEWRSIDWKTVRNNVRRLQMRIAKAFMEGKPGKVRALQWLLTHSYYARLLAVKRVTSNKGKRTPGVDGILWKYDRAKMQAVRSPDGLEALVHSAVPRRSRVNFVRYADDFIVTGK